MPKHRVPSKWGLCFAGNDGPFCDALDAAVSTAAERFVYVEIGLGYGDCLNAVGEYLNQFDGLNWERVGVDLPSMADKPIGSVDYYALDDRISLRMVGAEKFFADAVAAGEVFDFVFIDGCHGAPCVTADFLGAEKCVRVGGVVAFHDTDPGCQDIHMQPHCGTGIRARKAVQDLGLLDGVRRGWEVIGETTGNKDKGGHGCLFVRRIAL